ncbi:hypothetical protein [Nocardia sp. NPDC057668]|uniref:effector-associated constant component EACC1 n=1 Tax=Nocardia sp. NPDC057668 TaxID=3346202 RepID=UPI00366B49B5
MTDEVVLSISECDDAVSELHSLYAAMLDDDELRTMRKNLIQIPPEDGRLGAEELIQIVVDSKPLLGAVTACVTTWIAARKPKARLIIGKIAIELDGRAVTDDSVRAAIELAQAPDDPTAG